MKLKLYYIEGGIHPILGNVLHKAQMVIGKDDKARYQCYLANTLSGLAPSIKECEQILLSIDSIEKKDINVIEIEGRDVDVTISNSVVQIDINVNEDWIGQKEGEFSILEFKNAIKAWKKFLELPESESSSIIVEL
jgi:hypothetical protein